MQIFTAMFYHTEIQVQKEKNIFLKTQVAFSFFGGKGLSCLKFISSFNQNLVWNWKADDEHSGVVTIVICYGFTHL